jgi:formylglycine-generating enzyme required for sulfatase activity
VAGLNDDYKGVAAPHDDAGGEAGSNGGGDGGSLADSSCTVAPGPGKVAPSCTGLAPMCGPRKNEDCCAWTDVEGGAFYRSNDPGFGAVLCGFRLEKYEITVGRFRKFVAAYARNMIPAGAGRNPNNPSDRGWNADWNASLPVDQAALVNAVKCEASPFAFVTYRDPPDDDSRPMNCLTWFEAEAFCIWDGGRLPTEAEWDYAAAGGNEQRPYPWGQAQPGQDATLVVYGCYYGRVGSACSGVTNIAPVGSVPAGNGRWGQADTAGNIMEWVQDWYSDPYEQRNCVNCAYLSTVGTSQRVLRGGHFSSSAVSDIETLARTYSLPEGHFSTYGARCARIQ